MQMFKHLDPPLFLVYPGLRRLPRASPVGKRTAGVFRNESPVAVEFSEHALIVRDRTYSSQPNESLCENVGLSVLADTPVVVVHHGNGFIGDGMMVGGLIGCAGIHGCAGITGCIG